MAVATMKLSTRTSPSTESAHSVSGMMSALAAGTATTNGAAPAFELLVEQGGQADVVHVAVGPG